MPPEIVWREKEPIEYGSGSNRLHEIIENMVSEEEFQAAKEKTGIKFINKEHSFYYRIYSEVIGEIPQASPSAPSPFTGEGRGEIERCPCCGASMGKWHCRTCGFSRPLKEHLASS